MNYYNFNFNYSYTLLTLSYYIKLEWIAPTRHDDTFNIT